MKPPKATTGGGNSGTFSRIFRDRQERDDDDYNPKTTPPAPPASPPYSQIPSSLMDQLHGSDDKMLQS